MITGLVHVPRPGEATLERLADTLSALVEGVAAGLVGDAVVVVPVADADVATVADATGAALVVAGPRADPWRAGAVVARRDWVLCLAAGDVPAEGWIRTVDRFVTGERDAVIGRLIRRRSLLGRFAALTGRAGTVRAGDVVRRRWLDAPPAAGLRVRRLAARIDVGDRA